MNAITSAFGEKSRLRALLEHFGTIEDPLDPWRVAHPLPEVLLFLLVVRVRPFNPPLIFGPVDQGVFTA